MKLEQQLLDDVLLLVVASEPVLDQVDFDHLIACSMSQLRRISSGFSHDADAPEGIDIPYLLVELELLDRSDLSWSQVAHVEVSVEDAPSLFSSFDFIGTR